VRGFVFKFAKRSPRLGERVIALGFPLNLPLTVTQGSVSGLGRTIPIDGVQRRQLVQTDAAVNHGNSGGPLISTDTGEVVGLVDLGSTDLNGTAFAGSSRVADGLEQAWKAAPQPTAPVVWANASVPPAPVKQTGSTSGTAEKYVAVIDRLLSESAGVRKQLVAAVAEGAGSDSSAQADAASTLDTVLSERQAGLATLERAVVPPAAQQANELLTQAFSDSLTSDRFYARWLTDRINGNQHAADAALKRAQANDQTTVADKAAFLAAYNRLRARLGVPPLPSDYPF
jgi:hypothetical protein